MRKSLSYLKLRGESPPFSQIPGENTGFDKTWACSINDDNFVYFKAFILTLGVSMNKTCPIIADCQI